MRSFVATAFGSAAPKAVTPQTPSPQSKTWRPSAGSRKAARRAAFRSEALSPQRAIGSEWSMPLTSVRVGTPQSPPEKSEPRSSRRESAHPLCLFPRKWSRLTSAATTFQTGPYEKDAAGGSVLSSCELIRTPVITGCERGNSRWRSRAWWGRCPCRLCWCRWPGCSGPHRSSWRLSAPSYIGRRSFCQRWC